MRRREFIAGLGSAAAWPVAARAQEAGPMRRIGMLFTNLDSDPLTRLRIEAFQQSLAGYAWVEGRKVRIDHRWGAGDTARTRNLAAELVGLRPDVLVSDSTPALAALQQATRSIPIVFTAVADPVGGGFVASLAHRPASGFNC